MKIVEQLRDVANKIEHGDKVFVILISGGTDLPTQSTYQGVEPLTLIGLLEEMKWWVLNEKK